jgi:hypothetical protein
MPIQWNDDLDRQLRQARTVERLSWDEIAPKFGVDVMLCRRRATELGIPTGRSGPNTTMATARGALRRR